MKIPNYIYHALALLWLYSGIVPIVFNHSSSLDLLQSMGFYGVIGNVLFIGASSIDVLFALLIMTKYRTHYLLWLAQIIIIIGYNTLILTLLPKTLLIEQLLHPFGSMIKTLPILAIVIFLYEYHKPKIS
ncbi:DoxX-like family protein [Moraxella bovis]|uniref:DoxX-like family protein n=1 Tax=Moraxella bovis TaxID=476 RepID=UPI002227FC0E|nr:DoxX-like family protein [Moraxella bovis]UYZ67920.1 DoxX-like family protein [Moraxella bovis]UYZ70294.1 DoxX-like family protein [Moraxella bovis]UYZ73796.1 DoxX-like family protein [Moraxella bovis]UYZ90129.1 DoxX-like family protein [Moraxella bovis]UYZ94700.1 DoxX-like family protein [Moraxella bovis]